MARWAPCPCLTKLTNTGQTLEGRSTVSDKRFVLEPELLLNSYSTVQVSIWFWLTGLNFVGKARTSLKLRSMTTNCILYAVWHITNNSSGALDGAQAKESMNRPWLHSFWLLARSLQYLVIFQLPVPECFSISWTSSELHVSEFTFLPPFFFSSLRVTQRQRSKAAKC